MHQYMYAFDNILSSKSINYADGWTGKLLAKTLSRPRTFAVDRSRARKKADMRRGRTDGWQRTRMYKENVRDGSMLVWMNG